MIQTAAHLHAQPSHIIYIGPTMLQFMLEHMDLADILDLSQTIMDFKTALGLVNQITHKMVVLSPDATVA